MKKVCSKCGEEKELGEFSKDKSKKDKLDCHCKSCKQKRSIELKERIKIEVEFKICNRCSKEKKSEEFCKNNKSKDGIDTICKECKNNYNDKYYNLNSEEIKDKAKIKRVRKIQEKVILLKKICTICNIEKDITEFHKNNRNISGLQSSCKQCVSDYNQQAKNADVIVSVEFKICTRCKQEKGFEKFSKDRKKTDGLCIWCKECSIEYNRTYKPIKINTDEKICSECKTKKKIEEFHKDKNSKYGCSRVCKQCSSEYGKNLRRERQIKKKEKYIICLQCNEIKDPKFFIKNNNICKFCCGIKNCNRCKIDKKLEEYHIDNSSKYGVRNWCKKCVTENDEKYTEECLKRIVVVGSKVCRECNQEKDINKFGSRTHSKDGHKNICKQCAKIYNSLPENKAKEREWRRIRREDPCVQLYRLISGGIRSALKSRDSSKNGERTFKHLSYTVDELKSHIEKQFEPWMSWDKWGIYNVETWDDNDPSTWTFQIDHIIPQSEFYYTSMDDEECRKCWALSNLRPLSAKVNILDGARLVRHSKRNRIKNEINEGV